LQNFSPGQVHPTGRLLDRRGDKVLLERRERNRAAGFQRENLRDLGAAALDDLDRLEKQLCAFGGRGLRPRGESLGGRLDGAFGFRPPAGRDAGIERAVVRLKDIKELAAFRGAPFAADKVLVFLDTGLFLMPLSPIRFSFERRFWRRAIAVLATCSFGRCDQKGRRPGGAGQRPIRLRDLHMA
jgi:hypothetical protein